MNIAKLNETLAIEAAAIECWTALSAVEQAAYVAAYPDTCFKTIAAIKPLHIEQESSPPPHLASTHDALKEHHENQAAKHENNYPLASAHTQAAQMHDHAASALANRTPNARMLSQKAHNFSSANNLH